MNRVSLFVAITVSALWACSSEPSGPVSPAAEAGPAADGGGVDAADGAVACLPSGSSCSRSSECCSGTCAERVTGGGGPVPGGGGSGDAGGSVCQGKAP